MAFPTPRTTPTLVAGIIDADPSIDLTPFINTANGIVTQWCTDARFAYTPDQLELIERWLSAHFYAVRDPRTTAERAGSVGVNYAVQVKASPLSSTPYGQAAIAADYMGALAAMEKRMVEGAPPKPGINWVGKSWGSGGCWP